MVAMASLGCAAGGDAGDGGSNLPERGFAGYTRVLAADEAPLQPVEKPDGVALGDPFARVVDGRVELYVSLCPDGVPCRIAVATSADGRAFGPLETVAEDPAGLTEPYVVGDVFYAVRGEGAALVSGRLDGTDVRAVLEEPGARLGSPSAVDGRLFFTREADGAQALRHAELDTGHVFPDPLVVEHRPADWTPPAILQPEIRRATTGAGRSVYRMVYAGRPGGGDADLAFAAAFEGGAFSDWPFDPALGGDPDEFAPSNIRFGARYLLYFARPGGRLGLAERVADNPTESF